MKPRRQVEVGDCISIYWAGDRKWYYGQVLSCNEISKKCEVLYDDGERELVNLRVEKYEIHEKQLDWVYVQDGASETKRWKSLKSTILELVCKLRQSGGHVDTIDWWERWEANMSRAFLSRNIVGMSFVVVEIARKIKESISTSWWISQKFAWEKEIQEAKTSSDLMSSVEKLVTDAVNHPISERLYEPLEQQLQVVLPNGTSKTSYKYRVQTGDSHNDVQLTDMIKTSSLRAPQSITDSMLATLVCVENHQERLIPIMEENPLADAFNGVETCNGETILGAADLSVYPDSSDAEIANAQQMKSQDQSAHNHISFSKEQGSKIEIGVSFADIPKAQQMKDDHSIRGSQLKDQEQEIHIFSSTEQGLHVENGESSADVTKDRDQQSHLKNHNQAKRNHFLSVVEQGSQAEINKTCVDVPEAQQSKDQNNGIQVGIREAFSDKQMKDQEQGPQLETGDSFSGIAQAHQTKDQDQSGTSHMPSVKEQGSRVEIDELFVDVIQAQLIDQDESRKNHMLFLKEQVSRVEIEGSFVDVIRAKLMNDQEQGSQEGIEELCADTAEEQQMKDQDQSRHSHSHILSTKEQASEVEIKILNIAQAEKMDQDQSRQNHMLTAKEQLSQEIGMSFADIIQVEQMNDLEQSSQVNVEESFSNTAQPHPKKGKDQARHSQKLSAKKQFTQIAASFVYTTQLEQMNNQEQGSKVEIRKSSADIQAEQMKYQNQGFQLEIGESFGGNSQEEQIKDQDQGSLIINGDSLVVVSQAQQMKDEGLSRLSYKGLQGDIEDAFADISQAQQLRDQNESRQVHMLAAKEQDPQVKLGFSSRIESESVQTLEHTDSGMASILTGIDFEKELPRTQKNALLDFMRTKYVEDEDFMKVYNNLQNDKPDMIAAGSSVLSKYSILNGFLYFNKRLCIVKDDQIRNHLIGQYHASAGLEHLNYTSTFKKICADYFWPYMKHHVSKYVRSCIVCHEQENIPMEQENSSPSFADIKKPWEKVITKLVNGVPVSSHGHDCIFVVVDIISKQAHFIACKKTLSAEEIAQLFFWEVVKLHGIPRVFVSDDAVIFRSKFWRSLWKGFGAAVELDFPQCGDNYELQKIYETLEDLIKSYVFLQQQHWQENLHLLEFMYNNSAFPSSGVSPFKTMYGHDLCLPHPSSIPANKNKEMSEFVTNISSVLQVLPAPHASYSEKTQKPAKALEDPEMEVAVEESCIINPELLQAPYQNTRKRKFGDRF